MKKLITFFVNDVKISETDNIPEEIEILNFGTEEPLNGAVKRAKSKYSLIASGEITCDNLTDFFAELDKVNADIVSFDNGYLIKTALIKGVPSRLCFDGYCAEVYAVMDAKSIIKLKTAPFTIKKDRTEYSKDEAVKITASLDEFKKVKSKLAKDVYAFTAEIICARLCDFYLSALFAIKDGNADVTEIKEFDLKLKENIVLYLTMEKRFTALDLKKLRACGFKIGFWDYRKIKKLR